MNRTNLVEEIVSKIPPQERRNFTMTRHLAVKAEEQLRVLATKIKVGALGKGDTANARAAVMLEYIVRQRNMHQFSHHVLATAVGLKTKVFQELHHKVGNYLSDPVIMPTPTKKRKATTPKTTPSAGNKAARTDGTTVSKGSNDVAGRENASHGRSSIPALAIRLGSLVPDSHGFATRAEQLLRDVQRFINTKAYSSHEVVRREARNDLKRHAAVYEAACFYVIATKAITTSIKRKSSRSANNKSSPQDGSSDVEEEQVLQLQVQDVIRASNVSESVFQDVLPTVKDLAAKVARTKKNPPPTLRMIPTGSKPVHRSVKKEPTFVYSPAFVKWKNEVLSEARKEAKEAISKESGVPPDDIADSLALKRAADDVFRRNGLLLEE